jgi:hypothetical protein
MLFRAVDSIGGDGSLEEEELVGFMFPGCGSQAGDDAGAPSDAEATAAAGRFFGSNAIEDRDGAKTNSDLGTNVRYGQMNPML